MVRESRAECGEIIKKYEEDLMGRSERNAQGFGKMQRSTARLCAAVERATTIGAFGGGGGMQALRQAVAPWMVLGVRSYKATNRRVDVVLLKDFESLGKKGAEVGVRPGFARNFLVPQKVAAYATLENRAKFFIERSKEEVLQQVEIQRVQSVQKKMSKINITFKRHCTEGDKTYGSVTARNIVLALLKEGLEIDEAKVDLPEHIKMLGDFKVPITLPSGDIFPLSVTVVRR